MNKKKKDRNVGLCDCGRKAEIHHFTRSGRPCFRKNCTICRDKRRSYRQHKKTFCEACGFIALNACQLDVDHIDNNHKNDNPSNLRTLCANCHRLKTHHYSNMEKEWLHLKNE